MTLSPQRFRDEPAAVVPASASIAPFSQEAEEAVIGAVLIDAEMFLGLASFLRPDDFYILRHQYIWEAFTRLSERNERIDYLTAQEELRAQNRLLDIGGPGYLAQLINNTPTSVNAEIYGRLVERAATRRRLLQAADEIKSLAMQEDQPLEKVTSEAESRLFRVTERNTRRDTVPMYQAMSEYYEMLEHLVLNQGQPLGLPTGFRDLDALLGGLQRSDLLIFAGRPGMGKCVAAGTLIPTELGLLPIEQLKPEGVPGIPDEDGGMFYPLQIGVQTPDGMRQTSHFYDSGLRTTLKLTTRGGYTLTGTHVHPVLTLSPSGEPVWQSLVDVSAGDQVMVVQDSIRYLNAPILRVNGSLQYAIPSAPSSSEIMSVDRVLSVEDSGIQHCYDLTVPETHSFITNGIVSHNTSFLLSVAMNAAKLGARIAIFTMEMGTEQIVQRLVSMETGINTQKLRAGQITPQEWDRFVHAAGRLAALNIFIDDSPALTPLQMRTKCRRLSHEHGLDLVIVDYMQLMTSGGSFENNRVQEISYISRNMKELARELNVPVFSAAQLSRAVEQRQDKRPQLSDLRESGCLTGDSLVYLPDEGRYTPIAELAGTRCFNVLSLNIATEQLEPAEVTNAFCTGVKPVFQLTTQLGRTIRATANHKFLTICGWKRLDELTTDDVIALPATIVGQAETMQVQQHGTPTRLKSHIGDVYWDAIARIEPAGEEAVYDLTVPKHSNFLANDIIVHNSIEQDADIVSFLYRDAVYNEATEFPNKADVIIAKHRNGPTGVVSLHFEKSLTKFSDARTQTVDLNAL